MASKRTVRTVRLSGWLVAATVLALIALFGVVGLSINAVNSFNDRTNLRIQNQQLATDVRRQIDQFEDCKDKPADTPGCEAPVAADPQPVSQPGANGQDGRDGTNGRDGRDGKDGADSTVPGRNGQDGKDGTPGVSGADGGTGADGQTGQPGSDGQPGVDGKPGIDGQPGKDGVDGKNGADGQPGRDGANGRGVSHITCDDDGRLQVSYTDGSTEDAGQCPQASPQPTSEPTGGDDGDSGNN